MHADRSPEPSPLIARLWSSNVSRYLVVGGFSFLFDIGVLWLLHDAFHVALPIATPIAFLLSFVVTYTLQRTVAFRSSEGVAPSVVRYTILVIINTVATTAIVWAVATLGAPWAVGKVVAVIATTVWNYFAYRQWVFAAHKTED
ncbi:GtrA family protein [Microbacterium sp. 4R-513]|uniref:GtrA family protein n=1 Tax=Microbacterium sp. 4R-513 TaxID=2567934 RepID=UPI0013E1C070|nr:GtrA family protein [Microbacterium sp. 4R-513]QIG38312.1 GtrA family protein [Microbacterium sp. 4R-513]